jgi:hypothetical protein
MLNKSFGPNPLLGARFPALRDDPSNLILDVGRKSSKYYSIPPLIFFSDDTTTILSKKQPIHDQAMAVANLMIK